ncbi:unnamed protein product [Pleuronectes platessa]|uniref:Max dimerization protein 4 n=1 Tax=Pleuronectes platessa TaxID=8262 RepID=A0A9N7Z6J6_PLEPL|nr:unnamed protein product [Pleuronectes platessa]
MELNSLLILLEAAEYLERRDREAEHGYASVLPFSSDFSRKKTKASPISRKNHNNRSSHNELEKHRTIEFLTYSVKGSWLWGEPPRYVSLSQKHQIGSEVMFKEPQI